MGNIVEFVAGPSQIRLEKKNKGPPLPVLPLLFKSTSKSENGVNPYRGNIPQSAADSTAKHGEEQKDLDMDLSMDFGKGFD